MRASRLVTIVLLLQARGRATAAELAAELEVSQRTVYRDLEALGTAGVPVYGERGAGGGYRLVDGYRTTLTGLTADEAGTLLLAGAPGPAAELGLGSLLATTRLKLLAAVPPGLRAAATRAEERFHLDPAGWAHAREPDRRRLEALASAVWEDRRVRVVHSTDPDRTVTRTLSPLGLVHKTGTWYLVADPDGARRVYRVDRITRVDVLDTPARRPSGFDLPGFWAAWQAEYAASLPTYWCEVRLGPQARRYRDRLGPTSPRDVREEPPDAAGWSRQQLLFDDAAVAAAALLALAPEVEVLGPPDLARRVAATAGQLAARCEAAA